MKSKKMSKKHRALLSSSVALCLVSVCFAFFGLISDVPQNVVSALSDSVEQTTQSENAGAVSQAQNEPQEAQSSVTEEKAETSESSTREGSDEKTSEETKVETSTTSENKSESPKVQESASKTSENKTTEKKETSGSSAEQKSEDAKEDSKEESNEITITVEVTGSGYADVSGGGKFTLKKDSNAYDALKACGLSINASTTQYGIYVSAIEGLAEKEHGPTSGWLYSVNGVTPGTACSNYKLSDGDVVKWFYVA